MGQLVLCRFYKMVIPFLKKRIFVPKKFIYNPYMNGKKNCGVKNLFELERVIANL